MEQQTQESLKLLESDSYHHHHLLPARGHDQEPTFKEKKWQQQNQNKN